MAAKTWSMTTPADDVLKSAVPGLIRDVKEHVQIAGGFYAEQQTVPDQTIAIYAGVVFFQGVKVEYAGLDIVDLGTSGDFEVSALTADYYNKILFSIDSTGTLNATEGTEHSVLASVVEPTLPPGEFSICMVSVQDDGTGTSGTIEDIVQDDIQQLQGNIPTVGIVDNATETAITIGDDEVATFGQIPVGPASSPTTDNQLTRKKYITDNTVFLTGNQTVAGIKTFSSIPVGPASDPTTDNQLARKLYVDTQTGSKVERTVIASTATTSGTAKSLSITTDPWEITIMIRNFSTDGSSTPIIQFGTSGGVVTSGYIGSTFDGETTYGSLSAGWPLATSWGNTQIINTSITFYRIDDDGDVWFTNYTCGSTVSGDFVAVSGSVDLSGEITSVRIITAGGTDTFDLGRMGMMVK